MLSRFRTVSKKTRQDVPEEPSRSVAVLNATAGYSLLPYPIASLLRLSSSRPKPIRCCDAKCNEYHGKLAPAHSRQQQAGEDQGDHRKHGTARQPKSCSVGFFSSQCR